MKKLMMSLCALLGLTTATVAQQQQGSAYEVDTFTTKSGKTVTFHALMHASIRIQYDGYELHLSVPKFDMSSRFELSGLLQSCGVINVFDEETAQIPFLTANGAHLDSISQSARMAPVVSLIE